MPNQPNPAIEKQQVDIDLMGGLDESRAEEAVDWQHGFTNVINLNPESGSYKPRAGVQTLFNVDEASVTMGPIFRLAALKESFGAVGKDYQLYHWSDSLQKFFNKGRTPEFSVTATKVGTSAPPTTMSGVVGVAAFTNYLCIAYLGESNDASASATSWLLLDVLDAQGEVVIKSYRYDSGSLANYTMVGVDDRYLHIYQSGPSTAPRMFVIDTNSLPAGPTLSPSFTTLTGSGTGDNVAGVVPISGASVAAVNFVTTSPTSISGRVEKFSNSATSTANALISGLVPSGLDTDGTNFYLVGRTFVTDETTLNLEGLWRAFTGSGTWNGTASAGGSGGRNLTNGGTIVGGTTVNGFTPARLDGAGKNFQIATAKSTFLTTTAGTIIMLVKMIAVGTSNPAFLTSNTTVTEHNIRYQAPYGFYFNNGTIDGSVPYLPAAVNQWCFVAYKWDATNGFIKLNNGDWIKATSLKPSALTGNLGMTGSSTNQFDVMEWLLENSTMSNSDIDDIRTAWETKYLLKL